MTMRERIARALIDHLGESFGEKGAKEFWCGTADAVLDAMREPTEGMLDAGGLVTSNKNKVRWSASDKAEREFSEGWAKETYAAMITAAKSGA